MKLELNILEEIEIAVQKKQQKATFEENTTYVIGGSNDSKLHINPNCIYVEALNLKNAIKRLKRGDIIHES